MTQLEKGLIREKIEENAIEETPMLPAINRPQDGFGTYANSVVRTTLRGKAKLTINTIRRMDSNILSQTPCQYHKEGCMCQKCVLIKGKISLEGIGNPPIF